MPATYSFQLCRASWLSSVWAITLIGSLLATPSASAQLVLGERDGSASAPDNRAQPAFDTVVLRRFDRERETATTFERKGTIVGIVAGELLLEVSDREKSLDMEEVLEIRTRWSPEYQQGVRELAVGRLATAIELLQQGLEQETRPWAQQIIRAKLLVALDASGQPGGAANVFLQLISADPQTHFAYLVPLPWSGAGNSLAQPAKRWIGSNNLFVSLMGASWLLSGPDREQAIQVLEALANDIDPRVKALATAQLWRIRTQVNSRQVELWQRLVDEMPREFQPGPRLVLALSQAKVGEANRATTNLMRIPILHADQKSLCAAALYQAVGLLQNGGQTNAAASLKNELLTKYPESFWTQQVKQ